MDVNLGTLIQQILIAALPIVFAITLHEAAHGYVARHFGDPTAYQLGRVSLNPLRHIDLVGTVIVPLVALFLGGILFGWAKPVPVNFNRLRHPKQDMLWVAAAGPAANLFMIFFWAFVVKFSSFGPPSAYTPFFTLMGEVGISINAVLMVLNLIPLPPLDGGRIAVSLLPRNLAQPFARIEPYGLLILLVLLFSRILDHIMGPAVRGTIDTIEKVFGI